jgi:hypothetical protein
MKLSEAIILGSLTTIQRFNDGGTEDELCVIQTAARAIGGSIQRPSRTKGLGNMYHTLWAAWPWTFNNMAIHPVTGEIKGITHILHNLNDHWHWPRPKIAEWIKTIEPSEVEQPQETTIVEATR